MNKQMIVAVAALALFAWSASAHANGAKPAKPAVPPPPAAPTGPCSNFGGFYVGIHAGSVMYRADRNDDDGYLTDNAGHARTEEGGFGGGQVGYNWQRGCTVFGFEADGSWADAEAAFQDEPNVPAVQGINAEMDSFYTLRTRSGVVVNNLMLYVTGGLAAAKIKNVYFEDTPVESFSFSDTRWGWVGGFGVEWALKGRWSLKSEALYMQFEENKETFTNTNGTVFQFTTNDSAWIGRVGLNHRIGGVRETYKDSYKPAAVASAGPCSMFGGFYVGIHAGGVMYRADRNDDDAFLTDNAGHARTDEAGFGGGQVGYNWQRGCAIFGFEADGSWTDAEGVFQDNPNAPAVQGINAEMDSFYTLRTRSGVVVNNLMLYVTGGLAAAKIKNVYFEDTPVESFSFSDTRWGWTAGFGAEWALKGRWSLKSEALYMQFEEDKETFNSPAQGGLFQFTTNDSAWISRLGLNYKVGGARETYKDTYKPAAVASSGPCSTFGGFYVGIHAGGVMYRADRNDDDGFLTDNAGHARTDEAGFGGGQVGYNWQRGCTIFGFEGDGSWADVNAVFQDDPNDPADVNGINAEMDSFYTLRTRAGVVVDNLLLYVTGGLAAAEIDSVYFDNPPPSFSFSDTRWGWTAGFGAEWAKGARWTLKSEALYMRFEEDKDNFVAFQFTTNDSAWIGRLGLNYKIGGLAAAK